MWAIPVATTMVLQDRINEAVHAGHQAGLHGFAWSLFVVNIFQQELPVRKQYTPVA